MTAITLTVLFVALALAIALVWDRVEQRARRRDREIVRRIQTYLAQLPPTKP